MFDYKLLAALAAVVEQAGFERAAQVLGLSQSAVSQRIKLLEARVGQPVLVRTTPPAPTEIGRRLLNHVQQVRLLERELQGQVPGLDEQALPERLRIAINADSLATWWAAATGEFCAAQQVLMELVVEDQEVGLKRMRAGEVAACVCAAERTVAGARSLALGSMRYRALASPAFIARHFPAGVTPAALARAPAIVYGPGCTCTSAPPAARRRRSVRSLSNSPPLRQWCQYNGTSMKRSGSRSTSLPLASSPRTCNSGTRPQPRPPSVRRTKPSDDGHR